MNDCKVSIVIPVYNRWDLVHQLLTDLVRHERDLIDEVVVVDDCSPEEYNLEVPLPIRYFRNQVNLGFTLSSNNGLVWATQGTENRMVFLISSDVRIHGKFISRAEDVLLGAKRALVGNRHIAFDSGWNTFDGITFDYLEGWFLGATSDGWKDLGFFDSSYAPHDFEDIDLSTKAKKKGYKLVSLNNPNIVHTGAQSIPYGTERESITKRNMEYFQRKWVK